MELDKAASYKKGGLGPLMESLRERSGPAGDNQSTLSNQSANAKSPEIADRNKKIK